MRRLAHLIALFAFVFAAAAPAKAPVATAIKPAMWKIADADTTIWLFGTIHILPKDHMWETPALRSIADEADALVVEAVLGDKNQAAMLMLGKGAAPGLPPLPERVPRSHRPTLEAMIKRSGLPPAMFTALKTWAGAVMLVAVTLRDLGLEGGTGVDDALQGRFKAAGKPVTGLETPEQQIGFLDSLSEPAQREFLLTLLDGPTETRVDFDAMLAAWTRGDEAAIRTTFDEDLAASPELREVMLKRRNHAWAETIAKRLATPGKVLIAVGAGHLVGDDSVQAMLAAKGIKATRVQ